MRFSLALSFIVTAAATCAFSQEPPSLPAAPTAPPPLENTGKPITVPFQCTDADIQSAGLSCTDEDPCLMYLELSAVDAAGSRILAAGNLHTSAVTLYSILLGSEDGGRTWVEPHARIRAAGLDHLQFLDPTIGWASGQIVSPLPQEPFLLVTQDGGKSWRQRPILSESAENRLGTVQQFSFTAKDSGSLIIDRGPGSGDDRYELYESPDTGENWTIKESSNKPLRLKRPPPAPSPDWRIRADARTQAYQIEHRVSEKWSSTAAFSVKLPVCRPQPPPPPPPAETAKPDGAPAGK